MALSVSNYGKKSTATHYKMKTAFSCTQPKFELFGSEAKDTAYLKDPQNEYQLVSCPADLDGFSACVHKWKS